MNTYYYDYVFLGDNTLFSHNTNHNSILGPSVIGSKCWMESIFTKAKGYIVLDATWC